MRAQAAQFLMKTPETLVEALHILAEIPKHWVPFAGGTDLMVLFEGGHLTKKYFLNLLSLTELQGIQESSNWVTMGALTSFKHLRENVTLQQDFPNLIQAASQIGALGIQNRATLGGNIANASPAADSPPALLTYNAEIELVSREGRRWINYLDFHKGYKTTAMRPHELISAIRLPRPEGKYFHYYRKVGTRKAQAISKVCFSGVIQVENLCIKMIRIGLGSVFPVPLRCSKTESFLIGQEITIDVIHQARTLLAQEIKPISDIRSTSQYRLRVAQNLLEEFIRKAHSHVELA